MMHGFRVGSLRKRNIQQKSQRIKKPSPNFFSACLKGVFLKVCGPISVTFSGFVEMDTLSQNAERYNNLPTPSVPKEVKFPNSIKVAILDAACTKCVRGERPRFGEIL